MIYFSFFSLQQTLRLQKRGTGGVDTEAEGGVFDISNLDRLGRSEVELIQIVIDGVQRLIKMEKQLERNHSIHNLMPSPGLLHPPGDFPDLGQHNNWMAKCLTPEIYTKLSGKKTKSGFTLDMAIQTGVDNPGHPFIMTVGEFLMHRCILISSEYLYLFLTCCFTMMCDILVVHHIGITSKVKSHLVPLR